MLQACVIQKCSRQGLFFSTFVLFNRVFKIVRHCFSLQNSQKPKKKKKRKKQSPKKLKTKNKKKKYLSLVLFIQIVFLLADNQIVFLLTDNQIVFLLFEGECGIVRRYARGGHPYLGLSGVWEPSSKYFQTDRRTTIDRSVSDLLRYMLWIGHSSSLVVLFMKRNFL